MPRKLALLICLLMVVMPTAIQADGPVVSAIHVWIHPASPNSKMLFAYMTLENHSGQAIALEHVSSPDFASVVIKHAARSKSDAGTMSAIHPRVAAHGSFNFSPDHDYLVLTKPARKLYEGDLVTLLLTFSDHSSLSILAPVRQEPPGG